MSYMDKKKQLVDAFGTSKSKKKVTSMMSNMVEEGGITNKEGRGVRDSRLTEKAQNIAEEEQQLQKELMTKGERRQYLYSRDKLLPEDVLNQMPYKLTYEALTKVDEEQLKKLLLTSIVRDKLQYFFNGRFKKLVSKNEKKFSIRAFIYLDVLVAFYRSKSISDYSADDLAQKFNSPLPVIEHLLSTFAQASVVLSGQDSRPHHHSHADNHSSVPKVGTVLKYTKTKDNQKDLICHIIGIMGLLLQTFQAGQIARMTQKQLHELKSYF